MNFKDQVSKDINKVFHNAEEHADMKTFYYDGSKYNAPVILDYTGAEDRKKPSIDNSEGIYQVDLVMYVAFEDIKVVPIVGGQIDMDGDLYTIHKVDNEAGEIVLHLGMYDE